MPQSKLPHDAAYKSFFSDKDMVTSLFQDFVPEDFVRDIDLSTLELVPTNHVTKELRQRHDDIIWRVNWKDTYCYLYLLMEFQSTVDPFMAVRVLVYSGLLWEDLIATGVIKDGDKLPPIFPLVLYRGKDFWKSPLNIDGLLAELPNSLKLFQPSQQFFLIDELALPQSVVDEAKSPSADLIKLERVIDEKDIIPVLKQVRENYKSYPNSLKVRFNSWIHHIFSNKFNARFSETKIKEIMEDNTMFEETCGKLAESWKQEGIALTMADFHASLINILFEKFGGLSPTLSAKIKSILNAEDLTKLIGAAYRVNDISEFSALLDTKVDTNKNL